MGKYKELIASLFLTALLAGPVIAVDMNPSDKNRSNLV